MTKKTDKAKRYQKYYQVHTLSSKMLLVRINENNKIGAYFRSG